MGMWTSENQDSLEVVLKAFSGAARKNYGDHAFEAGYLQSTLISILPFLPKRQQKVLIEDMDRAAQRQARQYMEKLSQNRVFERV